MRIRLIIVAVTVLNAIGVNSQSLANDANIRCPDVFFTLSVNENKYVCTAKKLSWVTLNLVTEVAKQELNSGVDEIQQKMRNFAKREIPALTHEVTEPTSSTLQGMSDAQQKSKVFLSCDVSLSNPAEISQGGVTHFRMYGVHTKCWLYSFYAIANGEDEAYSIALTTISGADELQQHVPEAVEVAITLMGESFYERLSNIEQRFSE